MFNANIIKLFNLMPLLKLLSVRAFTPPEGEGKCCPLPFLAFHIDVPAVGLDDLFGNGQPQTCAGLRFLLRHPEEMFENPLQKLMGNAAAFPPFFPNLLCNSEL